MLEMLMDPGVWISFVSLAALEIVLGIDNIVFIAIMTGRLPVSQRDLAYRLGLGGALVTRLALLSTLWLILQLTHPLFTLMGHPVTGHALILIVGGLFLIGKSSHEIFEAVERHEHDEPGAPGGRSVPGLWSTVAQIAVIDIVFSLDSVITAVGIGKNLWVMAAAIVAAVLVMLLFASRIGGFVNRHPSMKVLALSFLLLIGLLLVAEGFGQHVDKAFVYVAMAFSVGVEMLNLRRRVKSGDLPHS